MISSHDVQHVIFTTHTARCQTSFVVMSLPALDGSYTLSLVSNSICLSPQKFGCFSCASPFSSCRKPGQQQQQQDDSDEEVVRRNDSEDFVIRCKESLTPCATSRGTADRPK